MDTPKHPENDGSLDSCYKESDDFASFINEENKVLNSTPGMVVSRDGQRWDAGETANMFLKEMAKEMAGSQKHSENDGFLDWINNDDNKLDVVNWLIRSTNTGRVAHWRGQWWNNTELKMFKLEIERQNRQKEINDMISEVLETPDGLLEFNGDEGRVSFAMGNEKRGPLTKSEEAELKKLGIEEIRARLEQKKLSKEMREKLRERLYDLESRHI